MKIVHFFQLALLFANALTTANAADSKEIRFGFSPGPYRDLVEQAIKPSLEQKGYKVSIVQFQDWVQPNLGLSNKEVDVNVFQHRLYLEKFSNDRGLKLSPVITIPTAGLGLYSSKIKSLDQLKKGDEVTISQDPTNLARSLRFLQKAGLVKLKADIDQTKATEHDIVENPKELRFVPLEAAQIPRSLGSATIAVAAGNFAIAAGLKLSDAIVLETLDEPIKIVVAIRTEDLDKQYVKDIKEVVESEAFHKVASDSKNIFSSFQFPDWYVQKWGAGKL
ncbi:MAG: MetQ/NlpA family ABC transporter substrate-binding protein [Chthoniobacteraceae bacterium]